MKKQEKEEIKELLLKTLRTQKINRSKEYDYKVSFEDNQFMDGVFFYIDRTNKKISKNSYDANQRFCLFIENFFFSERSSVSICLKSPMLMIVTEEIIKEIIEKINWTSTWCHYFYDDIIVITKRGIYKSKLGWK